MPPLEHIKHTRGRLDGVSSIRQLNCEEKKQRLMENAAKPDGVDPIELACWLLRCAERKDCTVASSSKCLFADWENFMHAERPHHALHRCGGFVSMMHGTFVKPARHHSLCASLYLQFNVKVDRSM